jgi:hypothetical protein
MPSDTQALTWRRRGSLQRHASAADRARQAAEDIDALGAAPAIASPFDVTDHAAVLDGVARRGEV